MPASAGRDAAPAAELRKLPQADPLIAVAERCDALASLGHGRVVNVI